MATEEETSRAQQPASMAGLKKIERAFEIRDELRDLLEEQLIADRKVTRRSNDKHGTSPTVWVEWIIDEVPDYTRASLLMGDVIHDLRAAMDHAMWSVTPERIQKNNPRDVAFPLHATKEGFDKWLRKRKSWYRTNVTDVLRVQQPYHAGVDALHPLHILQFLSNTDKHQLLNIVATSQVSLAEVTVDPRPTGEVRSFVNEGVLESGSVLARVEFARPAESRAVDLKPVFAYEQVFRYVGPAQNENWLQLGEAMNRICPAVVDSVGYIFAAHEKDFGV
ncbi:hypothetical protein [Rhodococcus erythropolis]|uniref:hypothetical protein n=1 Tax=Rhodococcus erythropolis TaxID=1833 RepID=UPI001D17A84C|nr:hypothetical protein [Rhodococcus erythropolis]